MISYTVDVDHCLSKFITFLEISAIRFCHSFTLFIHNYYIKLKRFIIVVNNCANVSHLSRFREYYIHYWYGNIKIYLFFIKGWQINRFASLLGIKISMVIQFFVSNDILLFVTSICVKMWVNKSISVVSFKVNIVHVRACIWNNK